MCPWHLKRKEWTSSDSDSAHEKSKNAVSTHVLAIISFMFPMPWQQSELMRVGISKLFFFVCFVWLTNIILLHVKNSMLVELPCTGIM